MQMTSKEPNDIIRAENGDVAIIGMACVFPKAPDLETYWQNIVSKVSAIDDPPENRRMDDFFDPGADAIDKVYCKRGGYISELPLFNPTAHGIMPVAIDGAEPEHFVALQVAHNALVDAGFPDKPIDRERAEVILGRGTYVSRGYVTVFQQGLAVHQTLSLLSELYPEISSQELQFIEKRLKSNLPPFNAETAPGLIPSVMAGLIANRLDLRGPNLVVDAACASALVALEIGIQDLRAGRCEVVLTGAVQLSASAFIHMVFTQLGALSRLTQLRPFAADADGTMIGEGVGMMVLKRRADAERDGHRIYALIKGVGSSSDGRAKGILAPRMEGEELALRRAYEAAGVPTESIELIEAHGTALPLGDVTEFQALKSVFGSTDGRPPHCAIGSVKSMIGHLLPAAGIAGLIKAALALYHKTLPPTLHCDKPNPKLEIDKTPFYINSETRPWIHGAPNYPRRTGVNSFGFGGINAHAVVEEYCAADESATEIFHRTWDSELCVLQADSRQQLIAYGQSLLDILAASSEPKLLDIVYSINSKPIDKPHRLAIIVSSIEELIKKLTYALKRLNDPQCFRIKDKSGVYYFEKPFTPDGRLAFLFPGEGSQYPNMLADLCLFFPEVRECFDTLDRAFIGQSRSYLPSQLIFPLSKSGYGEQDSSKDALWQMDYAVDAVLTADRALFNVYKCLDIRPDVILGHSSGEIMALEAAGAVKLSGEEQRIKYILAGNKMIRKFAAAKTIPEAPLIAIGGADPDRLTKLVQKNENKLFIAMDNCPHQVVVCCPKDQTDDFIQKLRDTGGICQLLPFARPYHTPLFEPAGRSLQEFFGIAEMQVPKVEMFSCNTVKPMPSNPEKIRNLAVSQWTRPVRFRETILSMYDAGVRLFLEVGPKSNLASFVNDILKGKPHLAIASNVHHRAGITQLNHAFGLLAAHGVSMRLDYLYRRRNPKHINLTDIKPEPADRRDHQGLLNLSLSLPVLSLGEIDPQKVEPKRLPAESTQHQADPKDGSPGPTIGHGDESTSDTVAARLQTDMVRILESAAPKMPGQIPATSADQVLQEYFQSMEQFLSDQQKVMNTFLARYRSGSTGIQKSVPSKIDHGSRQKTAQPTFHQSIEKTSITDFSDLTTADHQSQPQRDVASDGPLPGPEMPATLAKRASLSPEFIENLLFSLVSEKTGYPVDMLNLDQDLESDLGIDSIKRVEIFGALQKQTIILGAEENEQVSRLRTFQQIIDFFMQHQLESADVSEAPEDFSNAEDASAMPLIGKIITHNPQDRLSALREFDLSRDVFLMDHALGRDISISDPKLIGLPIMPLTMSIEMLAEAAALLMPNKLCIGLRDIRAYRWISFEQKRLTLWIQAKRHTQNTVQVQIRDDDGTDIGAAGGLPIVEGTVVFDEDYPAAPNVKEFDMHDRRPSTLKSDRLYAEGMFMGPCFQGVASVDWWAQDGIEATLQVRSFDDFFQSGPAPQFIIDPVLLDAAGQLVGYWIVGQQNSGTNVYPYGLKQLHIYRPNLSPGSQPIGIAKIKPLGKNQLTSDIDIIEPGGNLCMRLIGWEDRIFELPKTFHELRYNPRDIMLSKPWSEELSQLSNTELMECRVLKDFPDELLHSHGKLWQSCLAYLALSRREREVWQALADSNTDRTEWLLARICGKDAVRNFLRNHHGMQLCLADIEIESDGNRPPVVNGTWTTKLDRVPRIALTHRPGIGAAVVSADGDGCGISTKKMATSKNVINQMDLSPDEQNKIDSNFDSLNAEWLIRIWCAKEAVAKALGRDLTAGLSGLTLKHLEVQTGMLHLEISEKSEKLDTQFSRKPIIAYSWRDADLIMACSVFRKRDKNGAK